MKLNLPNKITISRFFSAFVLFVLLILLHYWDGFKHPVSYCAAAVVFLIGAVSDSLDGYLARKYNMVTRFGRIADPFADKILVCGTFILLIPVTTFVPAWYVLVIMARELGVTALRAQIEDSGKSFAAVWSGKLKMVFQSIAIPVVLVYEAFRESLAGQFWYYTLAVIAAALLFTVLSGFLYLRNAVLLLREQEGSSEAAAAPEGGASAATEAEGDATSEGGAETPESTATDAADDSSPPTP